MPNEGHKVRGRVLCYPETEAYTESDILVIDGEYRELYASEIANKKPLKCFSASKENLAKHSPIFQYYLKYQFNTAVRTVVPHDLKYESFFELWEGLVEDFNAAMPSGVFSRVDKIRAVNIDFFPNINAVLNIIEDAATMIIMPCLEATVYYGRADNRKYRQWTTESIDWLVSLRQLENKVNIVKRTVITTPSPTLEGILKYTNTSIKGWEKFEGMDARDKCYFLSSYMYGLALVFQNRTQYSISLLLLHRAVDLYFQSVAISEGLVVETQDGFKYTGADITKQVNPNNTFTLLSRMNNNRRFWGTVDDVNDSRNLLQMTHYVYGIRREKNLQLLSAVSAMITEMEGINRWTQCYQRWLPIPKISPSFIFETEGSMDTYLSEVN